MEVNKLEFSINLRDIRQFTNLRGYKLIKHQKRKKVIIKLICEILPPGSSILDIGSANGDISTELSLLNFRVEGIEPLSDSFKNAKKLAQKYKQNILFKQDRIEDIGEQKSYDLLVMGEILEHFYEPGIILKKLKKILKPNGRIIITVPNSPSLRSRLKFGLLGIFPDNNPEHKYYFDRRRFCEVVSKSGYNIFYFTTKYTNLYLKTTTITYIENIALFWFSKLFKNSGDSIFAIITPNCETAV